MNVSYKYNLFCAIFLYLENNLKLDLMNIPHTLQVILIYIKHLSF